MLEGQPEQSIRYNILPQWCAPLIGSQFLLETVILDTPLPFCLSDCAYRKINLNVRAYMKRA